MLRVIAWSGGASAVCQCLVRVLAGLGVHLHGRPRALLRREQSAVFSPAAVSSFSFSSASLNLSRRSCAPNPTERKTPKSFSRLRPKNRGHYATLSFSLIRTSDSPIFRAFSRARSPGVSIIGQLAQLVEAFIGLGKRSAQSRLPFLPGCKQTTSLAGPIKRRAEGGRGSADSRFALPVALPCLCICVYAASDGDVRRLSLLLLF